MKSGDLVFVHSKGIIGAGIRWAQRRVPNLHRTYKWNHVAVLNEQVGDDWTVIQADAKGVSDTDLLSTIAPGGNYEVVSLPTSVDSGRFLGFLRMQVGARYGYLSIASIALDLFLPNSICLRKTGTWICSGLVAGALWFSGYPAAVDWQDLYTVMPAEIANVI